MRVRHGHKLCQTKNSWISVLSLIIIPFFPLLLSLIALSHSTLLPFLFALSPFLPSEPITPLGVPPAPDAY